MLKRVPTVKTNFDRYEFTSSMIKAWREIYGQLPDKKSIAVIYAQWSGETGQGMSCWNFNIGNVKAADVNGSIIEYCVLNNVWEIIGGKKVILPPENPGSWFRSFPTLDDGVRHHFSFLRSKYKIAWSAVEAGDPVEFSKKLREKGYYTASLESYVKSMNWFFDQFMKSNYFEEFLKKETEARLNIKIKENNGNIYIPKNEDIFKVDENYNMDDNSFLKLNWLQKIINFILKMFK